MSGAESYRAGKEARADVAKRSATRGYVGDAMTRMVDAAVYRATHRRVPEQRPAVPPPSTEDKQAARPAKLGPNLRAALRSAAARLDALNLAELRTPQGIMRYLDAGAGAPVLLVHGIFGGSDAALRQFAAFVPDGFRIIAPSRFGYLGSTLPDAATPAVQADAFVALLDRLDLESVAVLAASAGAPAALQLAIRHPDRVSALVLVSPAGPGPQHDHRPIPHVVARLLWGSERVMWAARYFFGSVLMRLMGVPKGFPNSDADRRLVDAELDGIFPVRRRVTGALFDAYVSNPDIDSGYALNRVNAPVLVVHARDDSLAPYAGSVALAENIPGARLVTVDKGGHLLLGEHPEMTAAVRALLESTAPR